jgi:hypothetical protein
VAAAVEPGKHDGVEAIGLASISGLTGNERWRYDLAVEAVTRKHPLENKAGPGGLVAGPYRPLLRETPKQPSNLHEITREFNDFGLLSVAFENGSSD